MTTEPRQISDGDAKKVDALLLSYQQKWVADQTKVKIVEKSRRVGLSWADASESALTAATSKIAGGMDCYYIGYNKDMARQYISDVVFWAKSFEYVVSEIDESEEVWMDGDERKSVTVFRVSFASGFVVEALSSKPRSLRSKQGRVCIDEAAFHDELPELIKAANAFLIWGGRVAIISTHDGVENYFNELITDTRSGNTKYSFHRITLDDAIDQGLYQRICLVNGEEWSEETEKQWRQETIDYYGDGWEEELFCAPRSASASWLPRVVIEAAMRDAPIVRLSLENEFTLKDEFYRRGWIEEWCEENLLPVLRTLDQNLTTYFGEDFARSGDLTIMNIGQRERNLDTTTRLSVELRNVPFEDQKRICFYILDRCPRLGKACLDARGNGEYLSEVALQRYGAAIVETVYISQKWYLETMPRLKSAIEDRTLIMAKDVDHVRDFSMVVVNNGIAKVSDSRTTSGYDGKKRHGDAVVAYAMLIYGTTLEIMEYGYHSIGGAGKEDDEQADRGLGVSSGLRTGFNSTKGIF